MALSCETVLLAGYPNNIRDEEDAFALEFEIPQSSGVSEWHVSEPYINLWICNRPLTYYTSYDKPMGFAAAYRQRGSTYAGCVGGLGPSWSISLPWVQRFSGDPYNVTYYSALGGQRKYVADGITKDVETGSTMTLLWGQSGFEGVEVAFPSGAKERFQATQYWYCAYIMITSSVDPEGRVTTYSYDLGTDEELGYTYIRLRSVTDPDLKTMTVDYYNDVGTSQSWQIKEVIDPYNRRATFYYETNSPYRLRAIVNAGGLTNSFRYDSQGLITNAVTVYGTNVFKATTNAFAPYTLGGTNQVNRSLEVTEPNGDKHLFIYRDQSTKLNPSCGTDLLPYSYPVGAVPATAPLTNTFDNAWMDARNSFYWSPKQYSALSTNYRSSGDLNQLTLGDYKIAQVTHWLRGYTNEPVVTSFMSLRRDASPDGIADGQKYWYDYAGKSGGSWTRGTNGQPSFVGLVLPDGGSRFSFTERNYPWERPTKVVTTYSTSGGIALRTNTLDYAVNGIDLERVRGASGELVSSNVFNGNHQVLTNYNGLGEATSFTYNAEWGSWLHRLTSIQRPGGWLTTNVHFWYYFLSDAIDCDVSFSNPVRTNIFTRSMGLISSFRDPRGLSVQYAWNPLLLPTAASYPSGTAINQYTNLDLSAASSISGAFTHRFSYDSLRQLVSYMDPTSATNGVTEQRKYANRLITSVTNALGQTNGFVYDLAGRLISRIHHDKSAETYRYDSLGRLISHTDAAGISITNWYNNQGLVAAVSNAFGRAVEYKYDIRDRVTNVVDANGISSTIVYDNLDRVVRRSVSGGGSEGFLHNARGLIAYTNQLGRVTRYGLDVFGRKLAETNANGEVTRYAYNPGGDLIMLVDAKGQTNQWTYDVFGRVTSVIDATGATVTRYAYDADGRMTNRWTAAYGDIYFGYDANGNLRGVSWHPDGVGGLAHYAYDALNRLNNYSVPGSFEGGVISYTTFGAVASEDGPWDNDTVSYGYATNHLRSSLSLLQPNASPWGQSYGYDAANRLQTLASPAGVFGYTYRNGASLINKITLPTGAYVTNTIDSLGRLTGTFLKDSAHGVLNSHAYALDDLGQRTRQTRADGSYVDYGYDDIGQVTSAVGREPGGGLRLHESLGFGYDLAGNLHYRTNNALVQTFGHNSLNELTTVGRAGTLTVAGAVSSPASSVAVNGLSAALYGDKTFARAGFALADGTNTFTAVGQDGAGRTDSHTVAVRLPANAGYQYDGSGNLTSDGALTFTYDWDGRLESYQVPYVWKVSFFYDGLGRLRFTRDEVWESGQGWVIRDEKRYVYDGSLVMQERDQHNVPTVTYTRGLDLSGTCCDALGGIGGLLARTDHSALIAGAAEPHAYYHADGSGNVTMLVDSLDRPVAQYLYDPYGNLVGQSGPLAEANVYRFSSKEYDARSGLYNFGRRFYAPSLQRWLNRDPLGIEGGLNLYAYVGNGPVNRFDPWGLDFLWTDTLKLALEDPEHRYYYSPWGDLSSAGAAAGLLESSLKSRSVWDGAIWYEELGRQGNAYTAQDDKLKAFMVAPDKLNELPNGAVPTTYLPVVASTGPFLPDPNQRPPGWDKTWPTGTDKRGPYVEDPNTGRKWYPHPEDQRHWPHYDNDRGGRYPEKPVKPWPNQKRPPFGDQSDRNPWPQPGPGPSGWQQFFFLFDRWPMIIDPRTEPMFPKEG